MEEGVEEGPAALGYKGECHPTMEEYQPLGVSGHLSEGEANCAPALEGYQPMGLVEAEPESSSEDLLSRAEPDTAVQYRPLEDEEEELLEEGNCEGGETEREGEMEREGEETEGAGTGEGSADFRVASQDSSLSEPSSEGEGEGGEERAETGYMLLCQEEPGLNEEEEGEEKGEEWEEIMEGKLELQDYQPVGGLPPRMSKWLQKQVAELEGGGGQPPNQGWAKFDESSKAADSQDWPGSSGSGSGSSHQRPQRHVREEHVEPVNKMEEGSGLALAWDDL